LDDSSPPGFPGVDRLNAGSLVLRGLARASKPNTHSAPGCLCGCRYSELVTRPQADSALHVRGVRWQ